MGEAPAGSVVEVLPDVAGLDRTFHYVLPPSLGEAEVGTVVRVALHGRRTRGWVVATGTAVPRGVELKSVLEIVSLGPPPAVVDLCRFAAWRYAGRLRPLLQAASAPRVVRALPRPPAGAVGAARADHEDPSAGGATDAPRQRGIRPGLGGMRARLEQALLSRDAVLRLPPRMARLEVVTGLLELAGAAGETARQVAGDPLVLVESRSDAGILAARLGAAGWQVSLYPENWAAAAAGARVVVGTRNAVLAPMRASIVVVLDAHSESYRSERVPNFDARVLAAERARREGAPVCFVTPCPSVELLAGRALVSLEASAERHGWGTIAVLDARHEDPHEGGYPARLVKMVRDAAEQHPGERVVLVLNRTGRARLLACGLCRNIQRCPDCGSALVQPVRPPKGELGELVCPRCRRRLPALCSECGAGRLRILRPGVFRAREELAALLGMEVGEIGVMAGPRAELPECRVLVGTESVLHRVGSAVLVGFLDFDHELLASRFRAGEQALVLLARAVRIAGARPDRPAGRVVVRTSMPDHEVVRAAQHGNPAILADAEEPRRRALRLPPASALAVVSGDGAPGAVERLSATGVPLEIAPIGENRFLVRAPRPDVLADGWASVLAHEPGGWAALHARVEIDPLDS